MTDSNENGQQGGLRLKAKDWTGVEDPYNPGLDFPTAWAIQKEVGEQLEHHPKCSFVQAGMLCDCGAVRQEHKRRAERTTETEEDSDE